MRWLNFGEAYTAINMEGISSIVPAESKGAFFSGMLLSALNPLHIIFWLGWNTVLIEKKILQKSKGNYSIYTIGNWLRYNCRLFSFYFRGKLYHSSIVV